MAHQGLDAIQDQNFHPKGTEHKQTSPRSSQGRSLQILDRTGALVLLQGVGQPIPWGPSVGPTGGTAERWPAVGEASGGPVPVVTDLRKAPKRVVQG